MVPVYYYTILGRAGGVWGRRERECGCVRSNPSERTHTPAHTHPQAQTHTRTQTPRTTPREPHCHTQADTHNRNQPQATQLTDGLGALR